MKNANYSSKCLPISSRRILKEFLIHRLKAVLISSKIIERSTYIKDENYSSKCCFNSIANN